MAQQQELEEAVAKLEQPGQGVDNPTTRPDLLDGRWQLLYTSTPGTSSPVQRAFTGTEAFTIFQEIMLGDGAACRVNNVVELGDDARCAPLPHPSFVPPQARVMHANSGRLQYHEDSMNLFRPFSIIGIQITGMLITRIEKMLYHSLDSLSQLRMQKIK